MAYCMAYCIPMYYYSYTVNKEIVPQKGFNNDLLHSFLNHTFNGDPVIPNIELFCPSTVFATFISFFNLIFNLFQFLHIYLLIRLLGIVTTHFHVLLPRIPIAQFRMSEIAIFSTFPDDTDVTCVPFEKQHESPCVAHFLVHGEPRECLLNQTVSGKVDSSEVSNGRTLKSLINPVF